MGDNTEFKPPTECNIKIQLKIYALKDKFLAQFFEKPPNLPQFLKNDEAQFKIICSNEDDDKEYYVDENLIIKESDVLEILVSGTWVEGQAKEVTMTDTDCQTLENVLIFCCTKTLPMSAIDEKLAIFVDKYNMENLMDLIDEFCSMSLSTIEDKKWVVKWIPKLKMTRTALKLMEYLQTERNAKEFELKKSRLENSNLRWPKNDPTWCWPSPKKSRTEFATSVFEGYPGLPWADVCKGNKELSSYLGSIRLIDTKNIFPKYSGLKYSKNIMMILPEEMANEEMAPTSESESGSKSSSSSSSSDPETE